MENDNVNHPNHYTQGKVECIDAIESATENLLGIEAVCTGQVIKYIWRWKIKNGIEDLFKCEWYLHKLIKHLGEQPTQIPSKPHFEPENEWSHVPGGVVVIGFLLVIGIVTALCLGNQ